MRNGGSRAGVVMERGEWRWGRGRARARRECWGRSMDVPAWSIVEVVEIVGAAVDEGLDAVAVHLVKGKLVKAVKGVVFLDK